MSRYLIELYNPDGQRLADISNICTSRGFTLRRNRAEDISLGLNLEVAQDLARHLGMPFYQLFAAGRTEVRITRDNRPMVGGQLLYVDPLLNQEGSTLTLKANGFLDLLSQVYIESADNRSVANADMGLVAWDFINQVQNKLDGDFGITQGVIQTSRQITDTWEPYGSSIKEILIGFTDRIDGIDFEFTPEKVFKVYWPGIGTDKTELLFSYPGNISSLGNPQDGTTLANIVFARGSGNGKTQAVETRTDTASRGSYKRKEQIDDYPSISVVATLQDKGDETLRLYSTPLMIPAVTLDGTKEPYLGSYWIGDSVRFSVDTDRYPAFALLNGQTFKINEIACSIDENDHEDIKLKVGY
jgi:hypothetical protein